MSLAIFDLDHTLIGCDSDSQWPEYMMKKGLVDSSSVEKKQRFYQDYLNGCLNIDKFLAFQLEPLSHFSRAELDAMHGEFMRDFIVPHIGSMARTLVQSHRDAGHELLLISATNEFIITPIAQVFGIDNVIGVALQTDAAGNYTGRHVGTPSFQKGKVVRLHEWLRERGQEMADFDKVYFYSDSHNDLPLLELVNEPAAVNPDAVLRAHALQKGWPILRLY